jgi:hypothetical protein
LKDFLISSANMSSDFSVINVSLLEEPYHDFSWLFAHVVGWKLNSHLPRSSLYALYFSFQKDVIFDWVEVISNKVSF